MYDLQWNTHFPDLLSFALLDKYTFFWRAGNPENAY